MADQMEEIFVKLNNVIKQHQQQIKSLADKVEKLTGIGGGGSATIEDYQIGKTYKRNTLVVDPNTETVYRVISEYTSIDIDTDKSEKHLKLVGYESQFVTFNHNPTQEEIDVLPEDTLVAIYSASDDPYTPILNTD